MPYEPSRPGASINENALSSNRYQGFWRGRIEYNKDPLQQGRVKIRVWEIHGPELTFLSDGTKRGSSIEGLPWARPLWGMGGGGGAYDTGEFDVPPVGANVWMFFERDLPDLPVYLGTFHEIAVLETEIDPKMGDEAVSGSDAPCGGPKNAKILQIREAKDPEGNSYGRKYGTIYSGWREQELPLQPPSMGAWYRPAGPQMPMESQEMVDHDPTVRVYFKTPKGHSLISEDGDEKEYVQLVDRVGQGLRIEGFIKAEENVGNKEQRGLRSVFRGDQIERIKTLNEETQILLADILNQGLIISSRKGEERVKLISKDESGAAAMEAGLQRQEFELNAGHGEMNYRGVVDGKPVTYIRSESTKGLITLGTNERIIIKTSRCIIDASDKGTTIYGDVTIHGDLNVTGAMKVVGPTVHVGHVVAAGGCTGCGAPGLF